MDRLFEDFFGGSVNGGNGNVPRPVPTYALPLDVREVENGYEIRAQVPGFKPEEVDVTFSDGVLRITAQHSEQSEQESGGWLRREVAYGNYQRAIQMPGDVNQEDISANFEDGILSITVPKVPRPQPKKIAVSSGSQKSLTNKSS
ncbi:MAG TPA: Hsp20/alpha crystallin family protein [Candidatus Dormibacteraeota bacterium]